MTPAPTINAPPALDTLRSVIDEVVAPAAVEVDRLGAFPRVSIDALGQAGLLGLLSDPRWEAGVTASGPPPW